VNPVSLYVHVPYCAQKCGYCDFNSYAGSSPADQEGYVQALLREMALWAARPEMAGALVPTVFLGGGTPTLLRADLLAAIIEGCYRHFHLAPGAEVTIEANPGTIDVEGEKLAAAFAAGANRVSFGVQAYQPHLLHRLGRIHSPKEVEQAVADARRAGFTNINLDLMYGLPGQTPAEWAETLDWALSLGPTHISGYSLIVEEGTPFWVEHEAGRLALPPEEAEEEMFFHIQDRLVRAGFRHYEVANWAKPGFECRHNQVYWRNEPYLGLGCGAHSFLTLAAPLHNLGAPRPRLTASRVQGGATVETAPGNPGQRYRFWNLKTPAAYRGALDCGELPVEAGEVIDQAGEMAETMMLGLRMRAGVTESRFRARFGRAIEEVWGPVIAPFLAQGLLEWVDGALRLTDRGLRLGNQVWQAFVS
jgi:oxygen-independent coproporphyrinogen-3 oxidase